MSGDWIKMRAELHTHPKVVRIASALNADRLRIIGGLHAVWCLFDVHSEDGKLSGYTPQAVNELIGFQGFAEAMCGVKWLLCEHDGLSLPEFDEHNGQSAKRRATEAKRKRIGREGDAKRDARNPSASDADKKRTREEKRREDKETPQTPKGSVSDPDGFLAFWAAWPKSTRKGGREKCLAVWREKRFEPDASVIVAHVAAMAATTDWTKDDRQYVPAPVVYLRSLAWTGAELDQPQSSFVGAI